MTVYSDKGSGEHLLWEVVQAPKENEEAETLLLTLHDGDQLKSGIPFSLTIFSSVVFK